MTQAAPPTTTPTVIRVVLADDQPLVRTALQMVIADAPDLEVVGEAGDGAEAVRLAGETDAHVVVMDLRMPGMDGLEATRRLTADGGTTRVLVLTTFDDDDHVYGALRAGASGFLVKDMALDDILAAVRVVASGDGLIAPSVTSRLIKEFADRPADDRDSRSRDAAPGPLGGGRDAAQARIAVRITEREREVLTLVGRGLSNTEIAGELHITPATAKTYVTRLLAKLDARDRVQLVILAYEAGLVSTS
ncbi:response regulator [Streptomyces sp. NPDC090025]|uniref:response regulator n=1 Tax=Streptomyces sp. NPDC090025 TaxID=3365922 RepID=UPI003833E086